VSVCLSVMIDVTHVFGYTLGDSSHRRYKGVQLGLPQSRTGSRSLQIPRVEVLEIHL
jgi:hypothetical protein